MSAFTRLSAVLQRAGDNVLFFHCPGCDSLHGLGVGNGPGPRWGWNGSVDRPTFTPSVLCQTGRAVDPSFVPEPGDPPEVCHSFVTDGRIQFLPDSTHALVGQTVDLPELPRWEDE